MSITLVRKALKVGSAIWRSLENEAQSEDMLPGANELNYMSDLNKMYPKYYKNIDITTLL